MMDRSCVKKNKALQAPKKRDEMYGEDSARKGRTYNPDNLSVRAFRLCDSDSEGNSPSTENSSQNEGSSSRQQAMDDIRGEWGAFTANIMAVQIGTSLNPRGL